MKELFISLDVETVGPIPGKHPMLELGAAAFTLEGDIVDTCELKLSSGDWEYDCATMKWWLLPENYDNFKRITTNPMNPVSAMVFFSAWLSKLSNTYNLTPVAYPAAFDYMFVYWYLMYYVGYSTPLSFSCIDIKTYACAVLSKGYTSKAKFPAHWKNPLLKHTHMALDDAVEQSWIFIQMHRENLGLNLLQNNQLTYTGVVTK